MRASQVQASETFPRKWPCRLQKARHTIASVRVDIGVAATKAGSSTAMKALLSRAQLGKMEHLSMRQSAPAGVISQSRINECEGQFTIAHLIEPVLWGD